MIQPKREIIIHWLPQPRQLKCLEACGLSAPFDKTVFKAAVADIIGYGGAAGGGKTDTLLGAAIVAMLKYSGINIGYFRRTFPQLSGLGGAIERSKDIFPSSYFNYNQGNHRWTANNGACLEFCHCNNPDDVRNYQSQQFDILMIDEVTQFYEEMIKFLITRNRATISSPTFSPFTLVATNPGDVGHIYFKREFVDLGEAEKVHIYTTEETRTKERHVFIPAKLEDNRILEERDPLYRQRLSPDERLRRRLLEGDWTEFEGQAFPELTKTRHLLNDSVIPGNKFQHYMGIDWGISGKQTDKGAFAALFMALKKEEYVSSIGEKYAFNRVIVYREFYGKNKTPDEWAEIIFNNKEGRKFYSGVCDSSMFNPTADKSVDIASRFENKWDDLNNNSHWLKLERGTKNRIARKACLHNWLSIAPDGLPYIIFTKDCYHTMRTLAYLLIDKNNQSDVDTDGEDHLYDGLTYALNTIKFVRIDPGIIGEAESKRPLYFNREGQPIMPSLDYFHETAKAQPKWNEL